MSLVCPLACVPRARAFLAIDSGCVRWPRGRPSVRIRLELAAECTLIYCTHNTFEIRCRAHLAHERYRSNEKKEHSERRCALKHFLYILGVACSSRPRATFVEVPLVCFARRRAPISRVSRRSQRRSSMSASLVPTLKVIHISFIFSYILFQYFSN